MTEVDRSLGGLTFSDLPSAEVDRLESYLVPLARSVRALIDATIRTTVESEEIRRVQAEIDAATAALRARQLPGPAGLHYNAEGRSWAWGNAVIGVRNALAVPMEVQRDESGLVYSDVVLGASYEGPPGKVHGGVLALLLDHLMGDTASGRERPTMTGTLTVRYRRATPLGALRLEGRIDRHEGHKTIVLAHIADAEGITVEAEGIFVVPRWGRSPEPAQRSSAPAQRGLGGEEGRA